MEAGQFSLWNWAIVVLFVLLPLGYGIFLLIKRKDPASSKSRSGFFTGFGVGFVLVAASSGIQVFLGPRVPSGWQWIDLIVEAVIGGLVAGAIGGWISRPRKHKQE
jgi:hypothetical protein